MKWLSRTILRSTMLDALVCRGEARGPEADCLDTIPFVGIVSLWHGQWKCIDASSVKLLRCRYGSSRVLSPSCETSKRQGRSGAIGLTTAVWGEGAITAISSRGVLPMSLCGRSETARSSLLR